MADDPDTRPVRTIAGWVKVSEHLYDDLAVRPTLDRPNYDLLTRRWTMRPIDGSVFIAPYCWAPLKKRVWWRLSRLAWWHR